MQVFRPRSNQPWSVRPARGFTCFPGGGHLVRSIDMEVALLLPVELKTPNTFSSLRQLPFQGPWS